MGIQWFARHRHLSALLLVIAGLISAVLLVVLKPRPKPQVLAEPALPTVPVVLVSYGKTEVWVRSQGTIKPKREIDVAAQVSGRVVDVSEQFANGGLFQNEESLITIDSRDYQYALVKAGAQVKEAEKTLMEEKARARQAKREWRDLGSDEANELFLRKPQLAAAKARLDAAKAERDQASLNVERTQIRVPFKGRVISATVNLGQFVNKGTTVARVYSVDTAEVSLPLSDSEAALVGLPLTIGEQLPVELRASVAGETRIWPASLVRGDASMDTQTRQFFAVAEIENPVEQRLPMGLFVEARIQGRQLSDVVVLPRTALYQRGKVLKLGADNRLQAVTVQVLDINDQLLQVRGPLEPGDRLVSRVTNNLIPGIQIEPDTEEVAIGKQVEELREASEDSSNKALEVSKEITKVQEEASL